MGQRSWRGTVRDIGGIGLLHSKIRGRAMTTPARRQYLEIKAQYPDTLLAYQVGDFFEFFDEDAKAASADLQIVLTSRSYGLGERVPLAGVPLHALDAYLARLVARGRRVAVCEQVSAP